MCMCGVFMCAYVSLCVKEGGREGVGERKGGNEVGLGHGTTWKAKQEEMLVTP